MPNDMTAEEIEVLAESLIATYGSFLGAHATRSVRWGAHPGEECSRLFVESLSLAIEEAKKQERLQCAITAGKGGCNSHGCYEGHHSNVCPIGIERAIRSRGSKEGEGL